MTVEGDFTQEDPREDLRQEPVRWNPQDQGRPHPTPARVPQSFMDIVSAAVERGAGLDVIDRLLTFQERADAMVERREKYEALKAFDAAIAEARLEIPPIIKNRRVKFQSRKADAGQVDYRYEDFAQVARTVDPIIAKLGLTYRFREDVVINQPIIVHCILSHRLGHREENSIAVPRDTSGNKNEIQAIASAITYAQRILLKSALGLAAYEDTDAQEQEDAQPVTDDQLQALNVAIVELGSYVPGVMDRFLEWLGVEKMTEVTQGQYDGAIAKLNFMLEKNRPKQQQPS